MVAHGHRQWPVSRGHGADFERVGFRHPPALYEGPYDVLRWAYQALGDTKAAAAAANEYEQALAARESAAAPASRSRGLMTDTTFRRGVVDDATALAEFAA